ncbi:hypothetical protein Tco_0855669, partial [Tanacetum coccineum]
RVYSCQVDEQWFELSVDLLRKALAITPVNPTHLFELPPSGDTVIDFVNELGYPEPVEIVSNIRVNYVYQPWRAILTLSNQCLTGKTSGSNKPRHPVLQMLWEIVTQTNVDHAELIWEEFTQGIQTFFSHPKKKVTPLLIPYGRFSKLIPDRYVKEEKNLLIRLSGRERDHEFFSTSDSERTESETETAAPKDDKDQGEIDSSTVTSGTGSDSGNLHVSLAGPNPEYMDDEFLATAYPKVHENLKLITDKRVIDDKPESHSGSMSSMKNLDDTFNFGDQFLHDKPTEDDQEKSKVREESDSTIPDSSYQTVTSTPLVIAPFTEVSSSKPSLLVTPPPINTKATTITTSLPEITPFIALQLRVARLEQEMSEVKKTDHSADVLASIRSQVPTAIDNYLGTKLDDALHKVLERHTADLIEKYSVLPGLESVKNQESEKSPKEIIRAKKEQDEEKQDSTRNKSQCIPSGQLIKTANKNPANFHLYHALMEALIEDEDAMDKEVKDHKRKHDSDNDEDDDDDEGPSAGSNQGKSAKRRRHDSGASGSAQPPPKDDEQSLKKPQDSDASASKQHPTLTSTDWQITDTRDAVIDSSMHRSEPESKHSFEHSSDDVSKQDEGHVSDLKDTDNAHIPKVKAATWFKPIQEDERPATPEPEWTIRPNDFPKPENNWANAYATSY